MQTAWWIKNTPHNGIVYNKMWALHHAKYIPYSKNYKTYNEKCTLMKRYIKDTHYIIEKYSYTLWGKVRTRWGKVVPLTDKSELVNGNCT